MLTIYQVLFFIIKSHAFVDGNKRVAQSAMEAFLILNGFEVFADVDEQEDIFFRLSDNKMIKSELIEWIDRHIIEK